MKSNSNSCNIFVYDYSKEAKQSLYSKYFENNIKSFEFFPLALNNEGNIDLCLIQQLENNKKMFSVSQFQKQESITVISTENHLKKFQKFDLKIIISSSFEKNTYKQLKLNVNIKMILLSVENNNIISKKKNNIFITFEKNNFKSEDIIISNFNKNQNFNGIIMNNKIICEEIYNQIFKFKDFFELILSVEPKKKYQDLFNVNRKYKSDYFVDQESFFITLMIFNLVYIIQPNKNPISYILPTSLKGCYKLIESIRYFSLDNLKKNNKKSFLLNNLNFFLEVMLLLQIQISLLLFAA